MITSFFYHLIIFIFIVIGFHSTYNYFKSLMCDLCYNQNTLNYDNKYNERLNEINQLLKNNNNNNNDNKEKKENTIILSSESIKELEELIHGEFNI